MKVSLRNAEHRALYTKNVSERCRGSGVKNWTHATANSFLAYHFNNVT